MNKNKSRIVYESKLYSVAETIEILKKCPPDILFKLYHKYRKEPATTMSNPEKEKMTLSKLAEEMRAGFKQVNARIDGIDARLDYIVKVNNLKDNK